ncbi:DUF72 domain-containing protein [Rhizobium deserti]|uniref:DUF72 domain-containing protein n=1 Tax=Rhizobium deserti TaxID=2547961 RepID=A0A4R5UAV3_9HYPH|nr:DUF72 domain-containing protein [Rhizobium deserti]TDK31733.1 DUF72 domain-containing protein [Rhizobium deserti]
MFIGTAAWSIPKAVADRFPEQGSGLSRYSAVFKGVEINSTFYRRHRTTTFQRWADSVPDDFRFAVKMPKEITHDRRLKSIEEPFEAFLSDITPLENKLGPLLCQLPPTLAFQGDDAAGALAAMRACHAGPIVMEARHESWSSDDALALLEEFLIDRVLADPSRVWNAQDFRQPPRYIRLHGSPKVYYSSYNAADIASYLQLLAPDGWCIFDNTASGAAAENALTMLEQTQRQPQNFME